MSAESYFSVNAVIILLYGVAVQYLYARILEENGMKCNYSWLKVQVLTVSLYFGVGTLLYMPQY